MATVIVGGPWSWEGARDAEGYRTYLIVFLVEGASTDGPANVMQTPGLLLPGAVWAVGNDVDVWSWVRPDLKVKPHQRREGEPTRFWTVEQTASNKPLPREQQRCNEQSIEDPLLEPAKVSGSYKTEKEEATHDRFGEPIRNSAHEVIRGPQVEFDKSLPTVKIEQNVATSLQGYVLPAQMIDTVNEFALWGFPPRTIKLTAAPWELRYYGLCYAYYHRTLEFAINYEGWDRTLLDEGTKVLNGHWGDGGEEGGGWILDDVDNGPPDLDDPSHFIRAKDRNGENIRMILDNGGQPATDTEVPIVEIEWDGQSSTVTVTVSRAHGLATGETVTLTGCDPPYYDGEYVVRSVPAGLNATAFDIDKPIDDPEGSTGPGKVFREGKDAGQIRVEKYPGSDFLLLGIPLVF